MNFNSLEFLVLFLPMTVFAFYAVPMRLRLWVLVAASLVLEKLYQGSIRLVLGEAGDAAGARELTELIAWRVAITAESQWLRDVDQRLFDPSAARISESGKPSPRMDDPREVRH